MDFESLSTTSSAKARLVGELSVRFVDLINTPDSNQTG